MSPSPNTPLRSTALGMGQLTRVKGLCSTQGASVMPLHARAAAFTRLTCLPLSKCCSLCIPPHHDQTGRAMISMTDSALFSTAYFLLPDSLCLYLRRLHSVPLSPHPLFVTQLSDARHSATSYLLSVGFLKLC